MWMLCRRRSHRAAAVLGVALVLATGVTARAAQPEVRPMLGLPTQGLRAEEVPADKLVFTQQSDWTSFWAAHGSGAAPLVDFSQWQIAAVFLGSKPNPGYGVDITGYAVSDNTIEVRYTEWKPAPGMVYTQVIVHPYDIVAVPAGAKVSFKGTAKQREQIAASPATFQVLAVPVPSAAISEQYLLIAEAPSWSTFWARHFAGAPPPVDFARNVIAVVVPPTGCPPLKVAGATRIGDRIRVMLTAASRPAQQAAASPAPLLVVVPRAARVDVVVAAPPPALGR